MFCAIHSLRTRQNCSKYASSKGSCTSYYQSTVKMTESLATAINRQPRSSFTKATEIEEPFINKLWSLYCKTQNGEAIEMTGNTTREVLQRHARDIRREEEFAKRDERLARQEQEVARRELAITRRELDADQRERDLVERETALAFRGAEMVQRMSALKLLP